MPDTQKEIVPAVEFQALPLEYIIASPLTAAVKAQAVAAEATRGFIEGMLTGDGTARKPITVDFNVKYNYVDDTGKSGSKDLSVNAPLLSIVPVPHLRIDSLSVNFKYEITQIAKSSQVSDRGIEFGAQSGAMLSPWVSASLKGSVSSKSAEESTMNRSGSLEITMHASESPMPEGLAKILNLLSNSIQSLPKE
ncbi:MAG TPA: DUF2589 domain-containing protein [Nitrospiria bacterium]|nr:DUF2589 domain-containing protein [Nitrospiria bacterium]